MPPFVVVEAIAAQAHHEPDTLPEYSLLALEFRRDSAHAHRNGEPASSLLKRCTFRTTWLHSHRANLVDSTIRTPLDKKCCAFERCAELAPFAPGSPNTFGIVGHRHQKVERGIGRLLFRLGTGRRAGNRIPASSRSSGTLTLGARDERY